MRLQVYCRYFYNPFVSHVVLPRVPRIPWEGCLFRESIHADLEMHASQGHLDRLSAIYWNRTKPRVVLLLLTEDLAFPGSSSCH